MPGCHGDNVNGDQGADDKVKLRVFHHFLVELHIGEDGMDPPSFAEHGAEAQGESRHEDPSASRANVGERVLAGHVGIQAEDNH